jgi:type VI secretion system secreted protein Hcp
MNKPRFAMAITLISAAMAFADPAAAESNAYMRVKGLKQGEIKGSVVQKGREGQIMVIAMDHAITSPRDAASGLATGKRQHGALMIAKELDRSSPQLRTALVNNEVLSEVVLMFWQPQLRAATGMGSEVQYFTITLKNASISGIREVMPNNKVSDLAQRAAYEEVQLTYQSITWTWNDGGITASDDWQAPVQ